MGQDKGPFPGLQQFAEQGRGNRRDFGRAVWDALKIGGSATLAAEILASCSDVYESQVYPTQKNLEPLVGRLIEVDLQNLQLISQGVTVRVARFYAVSSHQGGRDERDLIVNVYSLNGDQNALIYDVQSEQLQPGQESLNGKGWWGLNVVGNMIQQDSSLATPKGDKKPMIGTPYTSFGPGENNDITKDPSGPIVLLTLALGNGESQK